MNPYLVEFDTVDEDGDTEHWKVWYRRILTETYLAITELPINDRATVERIHQYLPELVIAVTCNNDAMVMPLPMDIESEVFWKHPTFRDATAGDTPTDREVSG